MRIVNTEITFTNEEYCRATYYGSVRHKESLDRKNQHGVDPSYSLDIHIKGVLAEMAFCKGIEQPYPFTVNTFHEPDVYGYHIRGTAYPKNPELTVRNSDKIPDAIFIGVSMDLKGFDYTKRLFKIYGWTTAEEAKNLSEFYTDHGNKRPKAWFIPQSHLNPMDTLPELL